MSEAHVKLLIHLFTAWIKTVRGDAPAYGYSIDQALENGLIYREFWNYYIAKSEIWDELINERYLYSENLRISVSITYDGFSFLEKLLENKGNEYRAEWNNLEKEYNEEEILFAFEVFTIFWIENTDMEYEFV